MFAIQDIMKSLQDFADSVLSVQFGMDINVISQKCVRLALILEYMIINAFLMDRTAVLMHTGTALCVAVKMVLI